MAADYVYRTRDDSIRIRIFRNGRTWDFDVYEWPEGYSHTHCVEGACRRFRRKRDAKNVAERIYGDLISINPSIITEGW